MTQRIRIVAGVLALSIALMGGPDVAAAADGFAAQVVAVPQDVAAPQVVQVSQAVIANRIVEVRTTVTVRNVLPDAARNLVVVVPPTVTNRVGTQRVLSVTFSPEPTATRQTAAGLEATYKVDEVAGFATHTFQQVYTVELLGNARRVVEENLDGRYLAPEPGIESDNPEIQAASLAVTTGLTTTEQKAEALIRFVVNHLSYAPNAASRNKGALAGFQTGTGVCQEYAGLFVAMARASGIPSRLVYGWARDTGLDGSLNAQNRHVWAEYYDASNGWVAVDPTFAEVQENLLAFDGQNHIAQDWQNATFSASFGGRGLLSIVATQTLTQLSTAQR